MPPGLLRRNRTPVRACPMFNLLILAVMLGILVSLGAGLFFLVRDRGRSERTVISLSIRVALSVLLLVLLAWGFANRFG
jgi:hypothetical protein